VAGVEVVPGLEADLVERVVARLRELEPSTIAVLVTGSYAKGTADGDSDLDVNVVTRGVPSSDYRMWFEPRPALKPLHVSPAVRSLEKSLAERAEPEEWAFGFPVLDEPRYVWSTDEARSALGDPPSCVHPPPPPELEDFVEFLTKVRRASARRDGAALRVFAREAAVLAPGLLRVLNDDIVVRDRIEALDAALALRVAPEHYRDDLTVTLGLVATSDEAVAEAAFRLGRELLAFLRERKPDVDPQPDIARYLADGTLERHLGFATD
jgi:phosphoribosyl-AMP cyclohydrolase